jgi:hypothetical protein
MSQRGKSEASALASLLFPLQFLYYPLPQHITHTLQPTTVLPICALLSFKMTRCFLSYVKRSEVQTFQMMTNVRQYRMHNKHLSVFEI